MNPDNFHIPVGPLHKGSLLVALPSLTDPHFRQSVVYMCSVEPEGPMGLIINRPTDLDLSDALPDESLLAGSDVPVFLGGPVQDDRILLLRRGGEPMEEFVSVSGEIEVGGTMDALKEAATSHGILGEFRPYRGHAGWAPGQLEAEIEAKVWAVLTATDDQVFCRNPFGIWPDIMAALGGPFAIYATMPPDPSMN
ncbi:MAG: YqgE/AlgH family protein [Leptospirillia bacterium]